MFGIVWVYDVQFVLAKDLGKNSRFYCIIEGSMRVDCPHPLSLLDSSGQLCVAHNHGSWACMKKRTICEDTVDCTIFVARVV